MRLADVLPLLLHWPFPWEPPNGQPTTIIPGSLQKWKDIGIGIVTDAAPSREISLVQEAERTGLGCIVAKALALGNLQPYITGYLPLHEVIAGWVGVDRGWRTASLLTGYRLLHEAHTQKPDPIILEQVIHAIRMYDRERYLFAVGNLAIQIKDTPDFADAFYQDERCIYLHEFYPNRVGRPWPDAMALWVAEAKRFWRTIGDGRWWAILYVGDESIGDKPYYSAPTPEQFKDWWTTAFLCGATGISLFCGSSGVASGRTYTALDAHPELYPEVKRLSMFIETNKHLLNSWKLKKTSLFSPDYPNSFNGTARAGFYVPGFGLNYEMDGDGVVRRT